MNDRDLSKLLREMPREQASVGFKTRTLARLGETREHAAGQLMRWSLVGATLLAILFAALVWRSKVEDRQEEVARLRVESLRNEYSTLESELRQLRRIVATTEPVVGMEGSGEFDYLLDLQEITRASGGNAFPVSYRFPE